MQHATDVWTARIIGHSAFLKKLAVYVILTFAALLALFPFYLTVIMSFETPGQIFHVPFEWLPSSLTVKNFPNAFTLVPLANGMLNSAIVTGISIVGATLISAMAAYALAKFNFAGKRLFFNFVLAALMIPSFLILIPLYLEIVSLGLINSYWALVLPYLGSAYSIFLLRQYIITIPDYLVDAARIDGASELRIFYRIILPLSIPALVVAVLWNFNTFWNDFLWPLLVFNGGPSSTTLQVDLTYLQGYESTGTFTVGALMAASLVSIVPTLLVYVVGYSRMKRLVGLGGFRG